MSLTVTIEPSGDARLFTSSWSLHFANPAAMDPTVDKIRETWARLNDLRTMREGASHVSAVSLQQTGGDVVLKIEHSTFYISLDRFHGALSDIRYQLDYASNKAEIDKLLDHLISKTCSSLLLLAAYHGRPEVISMCAERGFDVSDKDHSVMHVAIAQNRPECVKALVRHGVDVRSESVTGESPMSYALFRNRKEIVNFFETECKLSARDATISGHSILEFVVGANLPQYNHEFSNKEERLRLVHYLAREATPADINSALSIAVSVNDVDIVKLLVETYGADIHSHDGRAFKYAEDIAMDHRREDHTMLNYLRQRETVIA